MQPPHPSPLKIPRLTPPGLESVPSPPSTPHPQVKSARAAKAVVLLRKHPNGDPEDLTTLLTKCPDVDIDQGEAMLRNNPNISLQDIAEYVKAHPDVDAVRLVQLAAEDSSLTLSMAAKLANILNYFGMDQSFSVMGEAREFVLNAGEKYVKFLQEDAVEKVSINPITCAHTHTHTRTHTHTHREREGGGVHTTRQRGDGPKGGNPALPNAWQAHRMRTHITHKFCPMPGSHTACLNLILTSPAQCLFMVRFSLKRQMAAFERPAAGWPHCCWCWCSTARSRTRSTRISGELAIKPAS